MPVPQRHHDAVQKDDGHAGYEAGQNQALIPLHDADQADQPNDRYAKNHARSEFGGEESGPLRDLYRRGAQIGIGHGSTRYPIWCLEWSRNFA